MDAVTRQTFSNMPPDARLHAALRLLHSARQLKAAALKSMHPTLSEQEIWKRVRDSFLHARD